MLRRFNTGYEDGNYSFPAGHVEEGESFKETAVREAKEEIGIDVKLEDISLAHVMHRVPLGRISVFMKAEKWEGVIRNIEPEKCDDLSWFNLDVLPKNTIPYIKKTIEDYKQKNVYSEDKQI